MKAYAAWLASVLALATAGPATAEPAAPAATDRRIESLRPLLISEPDQALRKAEALRVAFSNTRDRNSMLSVASLDWIRAVALTNLNRPRDAEQIAATALATVKALAPASALHGELLLANGQTAGALGRSQDALIDYHSAFRVFQQARDPRGQAIALLHLAASYNEGRDYQTALKYTLESIEIYSAEPMLKLSAYNNAGDALNQLGRYKEAEAAFRKALSVAEAIDSATLRVRILKNVAEAQLGQKQYGPAAKTIAAGLAIADQGAAADWRADLYGTAANVALQQNNLLLAQRLIERTFEEAKHAPAAIPMRAFHRIAYEIYRKLGRTELALHHLEAFRRLDDQAREVAASASANLMAARFDSANQDLKIARLRAERAEREGVLAQTQVRYHMILTGGLLAGAALIVTLLTIGFISIRRSRNQVRAANATLQVTNAELAKALAAKSEFLATTSHEIRTPLNGILGMTQVLLANRTIGDDLRSRVELIHGAGETMRALVDDILDMAKMETGELRIYPAEMPLAKLLRDAGTVWSGQAETKGIALTVELDGCPEGIVADEVRLRQIVFNLLSNAIKFTDRGGVRLTVEVGAADGDERLAIHIADSGIGIPDDQLGAIFEAFKQVDGGVTRRHGGTGLGLAICRNLARAMGGDVSVVSTPGAGSTFTLTLPLIRAALPVQETGAPAQAAARLEDAALLLIEPNPLAQGILRALLAPHVRLLHVASDLPAARAVLEKDPIDHVLADAAAFALDPAAALRFRGDAPGQRLTLLWPAPSVEIITQLEAGGIDQILSKPIAAPDLLARLRMLYDPSSIDRDLAA